MKAVNKITFEKNSKYRAFLKIVDSDTLLPVTVISGKEDGITVSISAGIHGGEYPGIAAMTEIANEIETDNFRGNLLIVHCANPSGFANKCPAVVYEDNENLNRMFPGKKEGTLSEKIAYTISNEVQKIADYYFDLHSGDLHEYLTPYVYCPNACDKKVYEKSLEAF